MDKDRGLIRSVPEYANVIDALERAAREQQTTASFYHNKDLPVFAETFEHNAKRFTDLRKVIMERYLKGDH